MTPGKIDLETGKYLVRDRDEKTGPHRSVTQRAAGPSKRNPQYASG